MGEDGSMTAKPPRRRHNPAWKDVTNAKRQAARREKLDAAAQVAGYATWAKLETAVLRGAVIVVREPE